MAANPINDWQQDRMVSAVALAVGIHLVLIFGLGFSFGFSGDASRATAVTFALTPAADTPDDARHLAAHDQKGEQEEPATEVMYPGASLSIAESAQDKTVDNDASHPAPAADAISPTMRDRVTQETRPSRNPRAGAVAARRALDADYLLRWRRRVEQVGNALYRSITARHGSGDVRLLVVVAADGSLETARVITSSGKPQLDEAAIATVRRAAPFPAFPEALRAQTDRLEIIRTWQFRHQDDESAPRAR